MNGKPVNNKPLHATIKLEHSYSAPLERVFSEFADPVARARWSAPSNDVLIYDEADFRVGGKDVFSCGPKGDLKFRGETRYLHIVANARVVSSETVDVDGQRLLLLDCSRYALCRRRPDSCLLLLGGRDLVLLPTLYAVRLDRVSDRTHSAGVQNCRDWSVVSSRSADSVETRADQSGQLSGMAIYHQSAGANQVAILTVEPPPRSNRLGMSPTKIRRQAQVDGCTTHSVGERDRGQLARLERGVGSMR